MPGVVNSETPRPEGSCCLTCVNMGINSQGYNWAAWGLILKDAEDL